MCIRDSLDTLAGRLPMHERLVVPFSRASLGALLLALAGTCLLYTSDAADERSSVDLGGRRIIKKKKQKVTPACNVDYSRPVRRTYTLQSHSCVTSIRLLIHTDC